MCFNNTIIFIVQTAVSCHIEFNCKHILISFDSKNVFQTLTSVCRLSIELIDECVIKRISSFEGFFFLNET